MKSIFNWKIPYILKSILYVYDSVFIFISIIKQEFGRLKCVQLKASITQMYCTLGFGSAYTLAESGSMKRQMFLMG